MPTRANFIKCPLCVIAKAAGTIEENKTKQKAQKPKAKSTKTKTSKQTPKQTKPKTPV